MDEVYNVLVCQVVSCKYWISLPLISEHYKQYGVSLGVHEARSKIGKIGVGTSRQV